MLLSCCQARIASWALKGSVRSPADVAGLRGAVNGVAGSAQFVLLLAALYLVSVMVRD